MTDKKVMVSGCFDLIHAGHIAFLKEASLYGKLYVFAGADKNVQLLKGKAPYFSQQERVYMLNAVRFVEQAQVASGSGILDFEPDMKNLKPDVFVVNSDGHTPEKEQLCKKHGVEYKVLERIPEDGLPARSSSSSKKELKFPYRLCIAGGWMDQPWVSEIHSGSVVVAQIFPTVDFNDRSGMATSSRKIALDLWKEQIPNGDPINNAKLLFGAENPPGSKYISGSQDHLGLLVPGVSRLFYDGGYWPSQIDNNRDTDVAEWLSSVLYLVPLKPRPDGYDPLIDKNFAPELVKKLGEAGDLCYKSILAKDVKGLGQSMTDTFEMWKQMLPNTVPEWVREEVKKYDQYPGFITSGSGGGYVMVASESPIEGGFQVKVKI